MFLIFEFYFGKTVKEYSVMCESDSLFNIETFLPLEVILRPTGKFGEVSSKPRILIF